MRQNYEQQRNNQCQESRTDVPPVCPHDGGSSRNSRTCQYITAYMKCIVGPVHSNMRDTHQPFGSYS